MTNFSTILPDSLVTVPWLNDHLLEPEVQVIDIRGYVNAKNLGGGRQRATYISAFDEYQAGHIPGAVFIDWTVDIVDPGNAVTAQIAEPDRFAEIMGRAGVDNDTGVVVVDHAGGHFATRLWWALRYYGHDRVAILDSGFTGWHAGGFPIETGVYHSRPRTFTARARNGLVSNAEDVLKVLERGDRQIIDARDAETYSGALQRGSRGGHIPTAVNLPARVMFESDGSWRSPEAIRDVAAELGVQLDGPVTAYCNGGVTATAVLFGLHRAGLTDFSNYDGSWNEWGEREDLPVEGNQDLWRD